MAKTDWQMDDTVMPSDLNALGQDINELQANGSATDNRIGERTISDSTKPTGNSGKLTTLFSWIGYMIKAITGKSNWRTAPATTLEAAKSHMDDGVMHITAAERKSWNEKASTAVATISSNGLMSSSMLNSLNNKADKNSALQVGLNSEMWSGMKKFFNASEVGLTEVATVQELVDALPNNSILELSVGTSNNTALGLNANEYGVMTLEKRNASRVRGYLYSTGGIVAHRKALFNNNAVFFGWRKEVDEVELSTKVNSDNPETTGVYKHEGLQLLSRRVFRKHLGTRPTIASSIHQKVNVEFDPGNFSGYIDVIASGGYTSINMPGSITKRFVLTLTGAGVIHGLVERYTNTMTSNPNEVIRIGTMTYDSARNKIIIPISFATSTSSSQNISVMIEGYNSSHLTPVTNHFESATLGSFYTDSTAYESPKVSFPYLKLDVSDGTAPLEVTSKTLVPNFNAERWNSWRIYTSVTQIGGNNNSSMEDVFDLMPSPSIMNIDVNSANLTALGVPYSGVVEVTKRGTARATASYTSVNGVSMWGYYDGNGVWKGWNSVVKPDGNVQPGLNSESFSNWKRFSNTSALGVAETATPLEIINAMPNFSEFIMSDTSSTPNVGPTGLVSGLVRFLRRGDGRREGWYVGNGYIYYGYSTGKTHWSGWKKIRNNEATYLSKNDNLDDLLEEGEYFTVDNATAATISNSPVETSFHLEVIRSSGSNRIQKLTTLVGGYPVTYSRRYSSNVWGAWVFSPISNGVVQTGLNSEMVGGKNVSSIMVERGAKSSGNFDTFLDPGSYSISLNNGVWDNYTHAPTKAYPYGTLIVFRDALRIVQMYVPFNNSSHVNRKGIYYRSSFADPVSFTNDWNMIYTEGNISEAFKDAALTGNSTATTQSVTDSSTRIATTKHVTDKLNAKIQTGSTLPTSALPAGTIFLLVD